jgi:hypothetical protein
MSPETQLGQISVICALAEVENNASTAIRKMMRGDLNAFDLSIEAWCSSYNPQENRGVEIFIKVLFALKRPNYFPGSVGGVSGGWVDI